MAVVLVSNEIERAKKFFTIARSEAEKDLPGVGGICALYRPGAKAGNQLHRERLEDSRYQEESRCQPPRPIWSGVHEYHQAQAASVQRQVRQVV